MMSNPKAPLWLLVMVTISGTLAMHMLVPALPQAAVSLGATRAVTQATISLYILGLAVGQLIYGPLSDALGRRPMLLLGLTLYALAGWGAASAPNVEFLIGWRLLQALGGCAGLALGRAIVRDKSHPEGAARDLALLNLMMMIGPGLAPSLGNWLAQSFGWRSVFVFLAALGTLTVALTVRLLPESGSPTRVLKGSNILRDYGRLLKSPTFLGFALGGGCATTSIYGFIAAAPFLFAAAPFQRSSGEVGLILGLVIVGMSVGNALTSGLVRRVRVARLLLAGNLLSVVSAVTMLAAVGSGWASVNGLVGLVALFALGAGMASPAALTKALDVDPALVGSAAGLYGFTQMAIGALCSSLVGCWANPAVGAASVLALFAVLGQLAFLVALRARR